MRNPKRFSVLMMAIVISIQVLAVVAHGLEYHNYQHTWYSLQCKFNGVCDINAAEKMVSDRNSEKAWLYIDRADSEFFDAWLFTMDLNGAWQSTPVSLLTHLGTAGDILLELEMPVTISDAVTGDEATILFLYLRLKGKEKAGEMANANISTVVGMEIINLFDSSLCAGSVKISGKLKNESKVPEDIKVLLP